MFISFSFADEIFHFFPKLRVVSDFTHGAAIRKYYKLYIFF